MAEVTNGYFKNDLELIFSVQVWYLLVLKDFSSANCYEIDNLKKSDLSKPLIACGTPRISSGSKTCNV
jgi:hypothetical protein